MTIRWTLALFALVSLRAAAAQPIATLRGRVFARGSLSALAQAEVKTADASTTTDAQGRFELTTSPGEVDVVVLGAGYEPLHAIEHLHGDQTLVVEYDLSPLPASRFQSRVVGDARREVGRFSLRDDELRQIPGASGDPFRVVTMMPGVTTPIPTAPLFVSRGASPGMSGFFLDGMRVPQLFHLLIGGGVVQPFMVERLDFYPSVYDVSLGHYAGGIINAETRPARSDGQHAMVDLRTYEVSTLVEAKLPKDVRLEGAFRYGFPNLFFHLLDAAADVRYWDYQLRADWRGLTVEAIGSSDAINLPSLRFASSLLTQASSHFDLSFHRVQIRERTKLGRADLEAAIVGGVDEMNTFEGPGVRKLSLGWRARVQARWRRWRLSVGTDGELSRFRGQRFEKQAALRNPFEPDPDPVVGKDALGELAGDRSGVIAGLYLEGGVDLFSRRLVLTLGVRADVYHSASATLLGIDPRLQLNARLLPWLVLTGGTGIYQQAPGFPVPLPGLDTFALQLGLQRAWQSAVGVEVDLPKGFFLGASGFYNRYSNAEDFSLDFNPVVCALPPPPSLSGLAADVTRQVNGTSFGMELLLRRKVGRVTGWIAYTLSRSEREYPCGLRPADFDQTHVLNVVVQARLPWKLLAGARLLVSTGRPATDPYATDGTAGIRNNERLPTYVQLDLRLDREWLFRRWALAAFLEVINTTYSQTVFGLYASANGANGSTPPARPEYNGFRWVLPSVGLRGRF